MFQLMSGKNVALAGGTAVAAYLLTRGLWQIYLRHGSPRLLKLFIYPIKSLAGIEVDHLQVTHTGMQYGPFHDRSYILLNEHGNMVTQRTKPKLALIQTSMRANELWLDAPGMVTLKLDSHQDISANEVVQFQVWGQDTKGVDCGSEVDQWFSRFLDAPTKLVKFVAGMEHRSTNVQKDTQEVVHDPNFPIVYQDGAPCLLINQNSIDDLNSRLDRNSKVTFRNFRPNILVRTGSAFDEDTWKEVTFGKVGFSSVKPCTRCTLTTVIPEKGVKHANGEPLRTLREYRVNDKLKHLYQDTPLFGINLAALNKGTIVSGGDFEIGLEKVSQ